MRKSLTVFVLAVRLVYGESARAQGSYRNLDAGLPVRIEDATVTDRYDLDLDLLNFRYDELSGLRTRFQYEPQLSYGALPRTEIWARLPIYYRERTASPRRGIAGFGVGAQYQLTLETQHVPALALATEVFHPTGPNALPSAYSLRSILTRSFAPGRVHLNASVASFAVRAAPSLIITPCPANTPPGTQCGSTPLLPPLDGPCRVGVGSGLSAAFTCVPRRPQSLMSIEQGQPGDIETHTHWLLGAALDRAFPLASTLVIGDFFAEKFEGLGRRTDMTAELGLRHQWRPQVVLAGAVGRHFRGAGHSTFVTFAMTLSHALQLFGRSG
jgi:hypothetical protein